MIQGRCERATPFFLRPHSWLLLLLAPALLDLAYAAAGSGLCTPCATAGQPCADSGELTLPRSMGGLPFDFTIEAGTPLACQEGVCAPEYVPSPASMCGELLRLKEDTQSRKRLLLSSHSASKPENEMGLSSWLLHFNEQAGHRTDGRSLLATAPRGRGPILPGSVIYTTINGSATVNNSANTGASNTFDPDLLPQIQADNSTRKRGLIEDQTDRVWLNNVVNEPHELASNMLAYQDGYPSLMAFEPHATSQPAATAMECFQQCDSTDGCQAWTTVAGLCHLISGFDALKDNSTADSDDLLDSMVEYKMDAVHESGTMARVFPEAAYGCPYPPSNDTQEGCVPLRANNAGCRHGLCSRSRQSSFGRRSLPSLPLHPIT